MLIELKPIDRGNYAQCVELELAEEQKHFVASNAFSLVQCAYEPDYFPLGIYCDTRMAGFIMYDYDNDLESWSMSRFMIDRKFQGMGIGKRALASFIHYFYALHGRIPLYTCVDTGNELAGKLYESAGFVNLDVYEYYVCETGWVRVVVW